jgi:hypothetical protein
MSEPNNPEYFPGLRFGTLQKHAQDWATFLKNNFDLPPLKNITLYNTPPFPFPFPERNYLILFEFPSLGESDQTERKFFSMLRTYMHNTAYRPAMFRNFHEVYREAPEDPFKEWYFSYGLRIELEPEPWLYSLDREHCWTLYARAFTETVRGSYLHERWQISDTEFISFVVDECLRGNLRIYDAFDREVSSKEIEELWKPIEKSRNLITLYKDSREKAISGAFVLELKIERAASWNETLQKEEEYCARLMTECLNRLRAWRYPIEDVRALESKYLNLTSGRVEEPFGTVTPATPENTASERKIWLSGHELVERYRISPSFEILDFVIEHELCPFDAKNLSPVLPPGTSGRLAEIRADIARLETKVEQLQPERNSALENEIRRLKERRANECIEQWKLFASQWQRHENSLRECEGLNDELNTDAIDRLLNAVYFALYLPDRPYEVAPPEFAEGFYDDKLLEKGELENEIDQWERTDPEKDPVKLEIKQKALKCRWKRYEQLKEELSECDGLNWKIRDEHSQQSIVSDAGLPLRARKQYPARAIPERSKRKSDYRSDQWEKAIPIAKVLYENNTSIKLVEIKADTAFRACFKDGLLPKDDRIRRKLNKAGIKLKSGKR